MDSIEIHHPNGISLHIAQDLVVKQTSQGYQISSGESQFRRIPEEVSVRLDSIGKRPEGEWPSTRRIGDRVIHYKLGKEEGGSGGDLYILTAWEAVSGGYIYVSQTTQAEGNIKPDFTLLWTIIEGIIP